MQARYADRAGNVAATVRFDEVWTFDSKVAPLFEVPSCVVFAHKAVTTAKLPSTVVAFEGHLPRRDATPEEAERHLSRSIAIWPQAAGANEGSPYRSKFRQGATIVPRRLAVVVAPENVGRMGGDRDAPLVESRVSAQDKRPWNRLTPYQSSNRKSVSKAIASRRIDRTI